MARFTAVNKLCSVYQWLREKPTLRFVVLGGVVVFVLMVVGIIIAFLGQQFSSPDAESPWVSNSPLMRRGNVLTADSRYGDDWVRPC